jgi:hypothetical protein
VDESLDQKTVCHDELRDEINVPVPVVAELCWRFLLEELLEELGDIQRRTFGAIEIIPIHVENFLASNGQQAAQKALFEAGSTGDDVILSLLHAMAKWSENSVNIERNRPARLF